MNVKQANIAYYDALDTSGTTIPNDATAQKLSRLAYERMGRRQRTCGRMLDVGCGTGWFGYSLALTGLVSQIVSLDISFGMAQAARDMAAGAGMDAFQAQADAEILPFCDNSFDLVSGGGFLHHLEREDNFFREAFRVLRPGGSLLIFREPQEFGSALVIALVRALSYVPSLLIKKGKIENHDHELEKTYSHAQFRAMGHAAGFEFAACNTHSFLHSILWYIGTKLKRFPVLYSLSTRCTRTVDFMDEHILRFLLPKKFFYEISACFIKPKTGT